MRGDVAVEWVIKKTGILDCYLGSISPRSWYLYQRKAYRFDTLEDARATATNIGDCKVVRLGRRPDFDLSNLASSVYYPQQRGTMATLDVSCPPDVLIPEKGGDVSVDGVVIGKLTSWSMTLV